MVASEFLSRLFQRTPRRRRQQRRQPQERPEQTPAAPLPPIPTTPEPRGEPSVRINPAGYTARATFDSPGVKDSTFKVNGSLHDPYYLPALPREYRSLFASICDTIHQDIENQEQEQEKHLVQNQEAKLRLNPQEQSPLFTRLPPEIRYIIYLYAFGGRRIHMDYDYGPQRYKSCRWSWWHRVCDDDAVCPVKEFVCPETAPAEGAMLQLGSSSWVKDGFEYRIDAVNWLRCCKIGYVLNYLLYIWFSRSWSDRYQESLPILYSSNTFVLSQGIDQLHRVTRAMPRDHLALLTSLCVEIDVYKICRRPPPHMDGRFRAFYHGFFDLIRQRLPNLRGLSLSIAGIPSPPRTGVKWSEEGEKMWVGPWEELGESRRWRRLEIAVPARWVEEFEAVGRRRDMNYGEKRYDLVQGLESFQKGW